jgi:CubicO group peptidase (beta-lactamase class C family)
VVEDGRKLVSKGFGLDEDRLAKFFPGLPAWAGRVTVEHLLHHTAGLPDYISAYAASGKDRARPSEMLTLLMKEKRLNFPPGSRYDYSSSGYMVLAQMVEISRGRASLNSCARTSLSRSA